MEFLFHTKTPGERARLQTAFVDFVRQFHIPAGVSQPADLALEEHLTNIISYGYTDSGEHEIVVRFSIDHGFKIEVVDDGRYFDLLAHPPPDLFVPAEERAIGGLGIHMIRQSMDRLDYSRSGHRNTLSMLKQFKD